MFGRINIIILISIITKQRGFDLYRTKATLLLNNLEKKIVSSCKEEPIYMGISSDFGLSDCLSLLIKYN